MLDLVLNLMHGASSTVYFNAWQEISILTDNLSFSFQTSVWTIASIHSYHVYHISYQCMWPCFEKCTMHHDTAIYNES